MEATPIELRRCSNCLQQKPSKNFRPSHKYQCNACHCRMETSRARKKLLKKDGAIIQVAVTAIGIAEDGQRIAGIVEELIQRFGGWNRLCDRWMAVFEAATKNKRHGRAVKMLESLWQLQIAADDLCRKRLQDSPHAVVLSESVRAHPEVAVQALKELGYQVSVAETA